MFSYVWPVALIVISNVFYQICAKSAVEGMDPFAMLVITYIVAAVASLAVFFLLKGGNVVFSNLFSELRKANFVPFLFGLALVGLEAGSIFAYKAGWKISVMQTVQSSVLAIALLFLGYFLYNEKITWNKAAGLAVCLAGLALINMK